VSRIPSPGGWLVYGINYDAHPLALFADELAARRWCDEHGYGWVVFWPFGKEWGEVAE
jgi:hypothetical protein